MGTVRRKPLLSRNTALVVGYGGILVGAWSLWEAYELRGVRRPFLTKFLPGA
ncbi:hypothetical protein ABZ341_41650 [Streptomyces sp. NPDC006173]|uniref:hypothetical protein n=1 Tax=Streptomyces sp. NPDC006173 TaxID=3155349 RepID=UPI003402E28B